MRSVHRLVLVCFAASEARGARRACYAGFSSVQALTLFSDRFADISTDTAFTIPLRERALGVLAAHVDDSVHLFCHCDHCIYKCVWDPRTCTSLQKMYVLRGLKKWHDKHVANGTTLTLDVHSTEDSWAWEQIA